MVKRIQHPIIEYSLETKVVFDFKPKTEIDFYDCLIKDVWCGEQGEGWRLKATSLFSSLPHRLSSPDSHKPSEGAPGRHEPPIYRIVLREVMKF